MLSHTLLGWAHFIAAGLGLVLGLIQFLIKPWGGRRHRVIGYVYVAVMFVCDAGALGVYKLTGTVNVFHVAAVLNFTCILFAMRPFYAGHKPNGWRELHAVWMFRSYIGLWAAALVELVIRLAHWSTRVQMFVAIAVITAVVTAIGSIVMRNLRRNLLVHSALASPNHSFNRSPN